jgi:hypothetical protein
VVFGGIDLIAHKPDSRVSDTYIMNPGGEGERVSQ